MCLMFISDELTYSMAFSLTPSSSPPTCRAGGDVHYIYTMQSKYGTFAKLVLSKVNIICMLEIIET